jgi:hypothetical protein
MTTEIEVGQFDDAPDEVVPTSVDIREEHPCIATAYDSSDELSLLDETDDINSLDDDYEDNRVEDEDWEIAERGMRLQCILVRSSTVLQRFHKALQSFASTFRCANRHCKWITL